MDFTLKKYEQLLIALKKSRMGFSLRHDVDLKPHNSLCTAQIEACLGVRASYYFRTVPESYNEDIIRKIAALGHEIGYHYESLTTCKGDIDAAYQDFCSNLQQLRNLTPISSICMHGSPRSPWDSRDIWRKYDYHALGINYEPYIDTDFSQNLYLTDTGRRWDGYLVSVRDKIPGYQEQWNNQGLSFHSTNDIIHQLETPNSPLRQSGMNVNITTHPQRWNPFGLSFVKEYVLQTIKNTVKKHLIKKKWKDTIIQNK